MQLSASLLTAALETSSPQISVIFVSSLSRLIASATSQISVASSAAAAMTNNHIDPEATQVTESAILNYLGSRPGVA